MADYDNRVIRGRSATDAGVVDAGLRAYMLRVYNYMLVGLALSGATAYLIANSPTAAALFFHQDAVGRIGPTILGFAVLLAPFGFILALNFGIQRMSLGTVQLLFWAFSALMGISLAPWLWVYTGASVAQVFFITSATFGAMSLWGYTTKSDLTGMGTFLVMGLFGLIIAMLVNFFLQSAMMNWVLSVIGVLVFTGLTAFDTQRIKESYVASYDGTITGKLAVRGALSLYLDFLNLFLFLLRLLGVANRR
jgi:FtsH-binding integral membrane protein